MLAPLRSTSLRAFSCDTVTADVFGALVSDPLGSLGIGKAFAESCYPDDGPRDVSLEMRIAELRDKLQGFAAPKQYCRIQNLYLVGALLHFPSGDALVYSYGSTRNFQRCTRRRAIWKSMHLSHSIS